MNVYQIVISRKQCIGSNILTNFAVIPKERAIFFSREMIRDFKDNLLSSNIPKY